ncbi:hypothetical protein CU669_12890 [Paramagnetospirillum kuznetsovii]|uniref:Uncharacterized protein n=1 Tax=Paramagnetospirillum kuznetsovii TaxID=2053833 RepID=A0A364NX01_9PROT|nr:hypothetical protein CU669_12890 [Paramagnetospirillum kuznetsovii]
MLSDLSVGDTIRWLLMIHHQGTKDTKRAEQKAKPYSLVMAGRVPATHAVPLEIPMQGQSKRMGVVARDKHGHDGRQKTVSPSWCLCGQYPRQPAEHVAEFKPDRSGSSPRMTGARK